MAIRARRAGAALGLPVNVSDVGKLRAVRLAWMQNGRPSGIAVRLCVGNEGGPGARMGVVAGFWVAKGQGSAAGASHLENE